MEFPLHVVRGNPIPLFCVILGYNFPLLRRLYGDNSLQSLLDEWPCATWPRGKSATLVQHASVAQGIEHRSPKAGVDGSNPPGGTREYDGVAGAAPFLVCGGRRRIRAVDTRVGNFPAGGSNPPGAPEICRARYRYGAGLFWFNAMSKTKRPLAGGASGRL